MSGYNTVVRVQTYLSKTLKARLLLLLLAAAALPAPFAGCGTELDCFRCTPGRSLRNDEKKKRILFGLREVKLIYYLFDCMINCGLVMRVVEDVHVHERLCAVGVNEVDCRDRADRELLCKKAL